MEFTYDSSLKSKEEIGRAGENIKPYIEHLKEVARANNYDFEESSINLAFDKNQVEKINIIVGQKISKSLKYIINIGIGGSNLGTKAIYDAFFGHFDVLEKDRIPKMIFADTNDPEFLGKMTAFFQNEIKHPEEVLICLISKSGTTTETVVNFEIVYNLLTRQFADLNNRCVVISDLNSKLWNSASDKQIATLEIPKSVGGRFSIFSPVGIFPLQAAGINTQVFMEGAKSMREKCLNLNILDNPALISATILYLYLNQNVNINDNFFFHPELESMGKWYRQLMGESIGKEKDIEGKTINTGITPTVSIGSTDLHSVGQLYLGGPKDKITTFVTSSSKTSINTPSTPILEGLVEDIESKTPQDIMKAIYEGVKIAYSKKSIPFMEIMLEEISEKELGEYMQFKMIEIMFLGKLLNVNTFDQPNVESYKIETKRILKGL